MQRIEELGKHLRQTDKRLELNKHYLDWTRKARRSKITAEKGVAGGTGGTGGGVAEQNGTIPQTGMPRYFPDEDMLDDL